MLPGSEDSVIAHRHKQYKKGIDVEESRQRREDITLSIRKTKKYERLNQRRRIMPTPLGENCSNASLQNEIAETLRNKVLYIPL